MSKIQAIRGMNDLLPDQSASWQYLETTIKRVLEQYGFREIRMPIVEVTELFKRSIGEVTDIVEKEMYTFLDRNEESLTLRPEGTASCVRAAEQHGLLYNQTQRLWYAGPMFRYEKPQKGRYRQFHQIGAECFGFKGPDIDAELLLLTARFWKELGLTEYVSLEINDLGSSEERSAYRDALVAYLSQYTDALDEDSQRRLKTNPLRILDSKNTKTQEILSGAPVIHDFLGDETHRNFEFIRGILEDNGVSYTVNPKLVRGLDYYNNLVFEWVTSALGAQGTVCAGGRYDGLVSQLGGKPTPGVGFAMGVERLVLLLESQQLLPESINDKIDLYIVCAGEGTTAQGYKTAEQLRSEDGYRVLVNAGGGSFKSQMKKADKSGAKVALIIGENELKDSKIVVKALQQEVDQKIISIDDLSTTLTELNL